MKLKVVGYMAYRISYRLWLAHAAEKNFVRCRLHCQQSIGRPQHHPCSALLTACCCSVDKHTDYVDQLKSLVTQFISPSHDEVQGFK